MKQVIGLTGGIASGKSTVTKILEKQGYPVIDADKLVHRLQEKGGLLYQALLDQFGATILDEKGRLDRPKLATLIFSSPQNQALSASLQDKIIRQALFEEKERQKEQYDLVFIDIPLLFEKGFEDWFDEIWLVYVDENIQLERLIKRNGFSVEEAKKRLSYQMPLREKKGLAHVIIDNSKTKVELENTVTALLFSKK